MLSLGQKVCRIGGLAGTKDVTDWESEFIDSIGERTANGKDTSMLTEKQIGVVLRIHGKHFGDGNE